MRISHARGDGRAVVIPKATAVFDAEDSRLGAALMRITQRMLRLQECGSKRFRVSRRSGRFAAVHLQSLHSRLALPKCRAAVLLCGHTDADEFLRRAADGWKDADSDDLSEAVGIRRSAQDLEVAADGKPRGEIR
jgi:hypothetical protein